MLGRREELTDFKCFFCGRIGIGTAVFNGRFVVEWIEPQGWQNRSKQPNGRGWMCRRCQDELIWEAKAEEHMKEFRRQERERVKQEQIALKKAQRKHARHLQAD